MTAEILIKFARKGIILSPEAYDLIINSENPINLSSDIIVKLKSGNYSDDMVPVDVNTLKRMGLNLKFSESPVDKPPIEEAKTPTDKPLKPTVNVEEKPNLDVQAEERSAVEKPKESIAEQEKPTIETKPAEPQKPTIEANPAEKGTAPTVETKPKQNIATETAQATQTKLRRWRKSSLRPACK